MKCWLAAPDSPESNRDRMHCFKPGWGQPVKLYCIEIQYGIVFLFIMRYFKRTLNKAGQLIFYCECGYWSEI